MWSALITPLAHRTEEWWGSVLEVGLDPELTKWSVRSGPAIVLTGKGYKEHHWLVVPPSTTLVISYSHHNYHLLNHAIVFPHHPWYSRSIRPRPCRCPCPWSDREPHQRWSGYYSVYVQRGRLLRKSFESFVARVTEFDHSMHVMRKVESILQLTTFIVVPILTTRTRMGLKTSSAVTSFMPSVGWLVPSLPTTTWTPINAPPSAVASSDTTRARKSAIPFWRPRWSTPAP